MAMSCSMVQPILETMYDHRREMVPCFIGAPGIGKTQGIYEFAEKKNIDVVTFILSNTVPSEISGIRMPDKESKRMEVFDDMRMASLKDGDILFFDEILEAPPMLWSACLTLIQDRIMASGRKLPDVFIVAASNPVASPGIIPASTRDRFQFIELEFDRDNWCKWFKRKYGVNPRSLTHLIKDDSTEYNILTPRRVEKLYTWIKDSNKDGTRSTKISIISSMFDAVICQNLFALTKQTMTPQEQIEEAILNWNPYFDCLTEGFEDIENMSLAEILEILQSKEYWPQVKKILEETKFEEQSKSIDEDIISSF